eukprot:GGOE01014416.1.p1 GENE.GGOE01014416.1~~GGOE01014416.1.p1  ORF type:complete len:469 (-),score=162.75 GGOE01014416.1:162-1403(-)
MCQKQCRDENGFRNHCSSESHTRQMKLFAQDKEHFISSYSASFEEGFLTTLKQRHGTARIKANTVYQEYIGERHHVHMNATKWLTLGNFVKYLGKAGICVVEQTPKGWFITYIDRDPAKAQREAERQRHEANDLDASERLQLQMEKQLEYIRAHLEIEQYQATELQRAEGDEPLKMNWKSSSAPKHTFGPTDLEAEDESEEESKAEASPLGKSEVKVEVKAELVGEEVGPKVRPKLSFAQMVQNAKDGHRFDPPPATEAKEEPDPKKRKVETLSSLNRIMHEDMKRKEAKGRRDYWLHPNIVVKVLNKKVGQGKYYKQKGVVLEVVDHYVAKVKMLDTDGSLKVDQEELETVVPQLGGKVLLVNGAYRGEVGTLQAVNTEKFAADVLITQGTKRGLLVQGVEYEDFSKLHTEP